MDVIDRFFSPGMPPGGELAQRMDGIASAYGARSLRDIIFGWISEFIDWIASLVGIPQSLRGPAAWVFVFITAALITGAAAALLIWTYRRRFSGAPQEGGATPVTDERSALRFSELSAADGDFSGALLWLYHALLIHLDSIRLITLSESKVSRQYVGELGGYGRLDVFADFALACAYIKFGGRPAAESDYIRWRRRLEPLFAERRSA